MKKGKQVIAVRLLEPNTGQLDWLPRNPRQWTREDVARTATSIEEDPDFLEDRPLLVVPHGKKWVVFAGNLRREGCLNAGLESVPCVTYQPEDDADQLTIKRRAMKDNGSFGSWDYDELANAWDDLPLEDWGVKVTEVEDLPGPDEFGEGFNLPEGDAPASNQITFYFAAEQKDFILQVLQDADEGEDNFGNENRNGNKLYQIIKAWDKSRT